VSTAVASKPNNTYTDAERRQAMAVYAFVSGREKAGVELLGDADLEIPWGTVKNWVTRHKEDYQQVKAEVDGHARAILADSHRRLATMAMENEEEALKQVATLLEEGKIAPKELPKLLQAHGIVSGIHTEKSELLSGHPTSRVASDLGDIEAALAAAGVQVIQGTAVELPPVPALPAAGDSDD